MKKILTTTIVCAALIGTGASAEGMPEELSAFRQVKSIGAVQVVVPTLVEVSVSASPAERNLYALYDETQERFVPHIVSETYEQYPVGVKAYSGTTQDANLVDGREETSVDYFVTDGVRNEVTITLSLTEPVSSSLMTLDLDRYVALPETVRVSARAGGVERIVVAETPLFDSRIFFPQTVADEWRITLTYAQPLRVNEIRLSQDAVSETVKRTVRFLAQPGATYRLYHDADRGVSLPVGEAGNLYDSRDVKVLPSAPSAQNPLYREADTDGDGVPDLRDNCVQIENGDQTDIDRNGRGDACDDFDRDGIIEVKDNCPSMPNRDQSDVDGDEIGDVCDEEESRFTEKYAWIPWVGMGIAGGVIIVLFALVATTPRRQDTSSVQ